MKIENIMTNKVATIRDNATLADAARVMWENACGIVPVLEAQSGRICGVITDRDVCMGALFEGKPVQQVQVASSMTRIVYTCQADHDVVAVEEMMKRHRIRRVPVVDKQDRVIGIVSLDDLALKACSTEGGARKLKQEVAETLGGICAHWRTPFKMDQGQGGCA